MCTWYLRIGAYFVGSLFMRLNAVWSVADAPVATALPVVAVATGASATDQTAFNLMNKDPTKYAPIRKYHVHIYFVAPCSVPTGGGTVCTGSSDDNGRPIPTLKRIELASNGTMNVISLVEGIENLQVDYGIDGDKDGVPDTTYVAC